MKTPMVKHQCPSPNVLSDILLGRLSREELDCWEEHLRQCETCLSTAKDLHESDKLVRAIQSSTRVKIDDQNLAELLSKGRSLFRETHAQAGDETSDFTGADTSGSSRSSFEAEAPTLDFLGPALEDGDLGSLAGYRVIKLLGQGGMGMVFQAEDSTLQRQVALKVMMPRREGNDDYRQRFLREARAMAAVNCDNVVPIFQVGEHSGRPFIAMPLLEGESLDTCLERESSLSIDQVCRIGAETAKGLEAAKAKGLIHRDIKPDNLWLEAPTGRVKILDFGLARGDGDSELTHSGAVLGTPRYMSPEQAEGKPLDHRTDLFSLGSVLYHCLVGKPPFHGKSLGATLLDVIRKEPEPILSLRKEVPAGLSSLIMQLLAKAPEQRPKSAGVVADTLEQLVIEIETQAVGGTSGQTQAETKTPDTQRSAVHSAPAWFNARTAAILVTLGLIALIATVIIKWRPESGGLVTITVNDHEQVQEIDISEDSATIIDPNDNQEIKLTVDRSKQQLIMRKDGFEAQVKSFSLASADGRKISVKFEPDRRLEETPQARNQGGGVSTAGNRLSVETFSREREIAEWVISHGGSVQVQFGDEGWRGDTIERIEDLPREPFLVSSVAISKADNEAELKILTGLSREVGVWLVNAPITGECFEYLRQIPKLDSLRIDYCQNIDPAELSHLSNCQSLRSIDALGCNLGDELADLAAQLESLESIHCGKRLTGAGLKKLVTNPSIREISLINCSRLQAGDFAHLSALDNLTTLTLEPNQVNAEVMEHVAILEKLVNLRIQDIDNTRALDVTLLSPLGKMTSIENLSLAYTPLIPSECEPLKQCQNLRSIDLTATGLSYEDVYLFGKSFPNTKILWNSGIVPTASERFDRQTEFLKWLVGIGGTASFLDSLGEAKECSSLDTMPAELVDLGQVTYPDFSDADLKAFSGLGRLGAINLQGSPLSGSGLKYLNSPDRVYVQALFMENCRQIQDQNLDLLSALTELRTICLHETPVGDSLVDVALQLPNLGYLGLGEQVTAAGLNRLSSHPRISILVISQSTQFTAKELLPLQKMVRLEDLSIGAPMATSEHLEVLAKLPDLRKLQVFGELASAEPLARMKNIERLTLADLGTSRFDDSALHRMTWVKELQILGTNPFSRAAIQALQSALPSCDIQWQE